MSMEESSYRYGRMQKNDGTGHRQHEPFALRENRLSESPADMISCRKLYDCLLEALQTSRLRGKDEKKP